jgi:hypothetical protein
LCFAGAESRQAFDFSEEAIRLLGHKQGFTGISYDELVAQYSQAVAAASSAAFNQSKLARKVCCSSFALLLTQFSVRSLHKWPWVNEIQK